MPAMMPRKPFSAIRRFSPAVLRAALLGDQPLQPLGLARGRAGGLGQRGVDLLDRRAVAHQQVQVPLFRIAVAELVHLLELLAGVDMDHRKRHMAAEGLLGQPDHDVRVLAQRPQHPGGVDARVGLAEDVNGLRFEFVQPLHGAVSHKELMDYDISHAHCGVLA